MNVPGFLARQFYVSGSLRNIPGGFSLQARNPMGEGTLVGVGRIAVDGHEIPASAITAQRGGDAERIRASDVSPARPIAIHKGDTVTLQIDGEPLEPGDHKLEVELHELNIGALRFSLKDRLAAAG